jgi:diguanylate cyclase (GGDEF)-like protein/PAS domain S-box-containing protein
MSGKYEVKYARDTAVGVIERNALVINLMILLIIFTILLVIVRFIYSVLNYIPIHSIVAMLSMVAGLMIMATFLIQSTSQKGVRTLNGYVDQLNGLLTAMQEKEKKYSYLFHFSNDGIFLHDSLGNILDVNQKMLEMLKFSKSGFLSRKVFGLYPPDEIERAMSAMNKLMKDGRDSFEVVFKRSNGEMFPAETSSNVIELEGKKVIQCMVRDITERRKMEDQLRTISITDELTGLLNRRGFFTMAEQQLKIANRSGRGMFVLFTDIDDLKSINDSFGHHEGDRALIETAGLLKRNVRTSDIVARLGGDEFVVLMVDVSHKADGGIITSRLGEKLQELNSRPNSKYRLSLSIGLARYNPDEARSVEELIMRADKFMYGYKRRKSAGPASHPRSNEAGV